MNRWATRALGTIVAAAVVVTIAAGAPASASTAEPEDSPSVRVVPADDTGIAAAAARLVAGLSLEQRAASVVMGHVPTTDDATLRRYMEENALGGFILMGANIPGSESSLRRLTAALTTDPALPPLIAIDEEGGQVTRLPWDDFPAANTLKQEPAGAAADAYRARAALVQRAGVGVNFGIVADVADGRSSFIYGRALGTSPDASAERVTAAIDGERGQALSTVKHFPGHGAAAGDSHQTIPATGMSKKDWAATDGVPFAAAIADGVPLVMFGHLRYTAVDDAPASLSAEWHRIVRDELGFTGVTITDDLGMLQASGVRAYRDPVDNAVAALKAGNDMVLAVMFTTAGSAAALVDGIVAAVEDGELSQGRLDEAATRVAALRLELAAGGRGLVPCDDCEAAG